MKLEEGKKRFIQTFGSLGSKWGINRTMAQVHALLLVSPESLSAEDIMQELSISRGNANMNLRALIDWGLIMKESKAGERKEFFYAEKDIWQVTRQIIIERKKRELDPIRSVLQELKDIEGEGEDVDAFKKMVADLDDFSEKADKTLEKVTKTDRHWFFNALLKIMGM
ncbi:MAG: GbsR/MarR family transcriptional regulator [Chitinophagales bacterium]